MFIITVFKQLPIIYWGNSVELRFTLLLTNSTDTHLLKVALRFLAAAKFPAFRWLNQNIGRRAQAHVETSTAIFRRIAWKCINFVNSESCSHTDTTFTNSPMPFHALPVAPFRIPSVAC